MRISLIAAMSSNRVIGKDNKLPWNLSKDLAFFKKSTINKTILMGRKTCESLTGPLPNRNNVVITSNPAFVTNKPGFHIASSIEEGLFMANYMDNALDNEVMIIGGEKIYRQMIHRATTLYLTEIKQEFEGDAHFPLFDKTMFREVERIPNTEKGIKFDFVTYRRR